jgi:deoxyribose-phosphate aldolase
MYVARAKAYVGDRLPICTVIGFPCGYATTAAKCFEAADAVQNGADEIDMVIPVGALKAGEDDYVRDEIIAVKAACAGCVLKVIIETCLLTEEEKLRASRIVTEAGADFIKTSTGFSTGGATREDVALLRANVGKDIKVKAAGGIANLTDAADMIALGADRLGTSRVVAAVKALDGKSTPTPDASY